jgi:glycine cleavage system transcriptional repressor
VHLVSNALYERGCAISELTQTTLHGQFAGLFSVEAPEALDAAGLEEALRAELSPAGYSAWLSPMAPRLPAKRPDAEPYVMTISGPDSPALIPTLTAKVASFDANIENLRSVVLSGSPDSAETKSPVVLALEISLPVTVERRVFREALAVTAGELGLEISLQHRNIFEAIHRV